MALGCLKDMEEIEDRKPSSSGFLTHACCQRCCIWPIYGNTFYVRELAFAHSRSHVLINAWISWLVIVGGEFERLPDSFSNKMLIKRLDNWIHAATHSTQFTFYNDTTPLNEISDLDYEIFNDTGVDYRGSFTLPDFCDTTLYSPLPQNVSSAPLPCSLNETGGSTNVQDAVDVYLTLDTGISQFTSDFNGLNFVTLEKEEAENTATQYWVVTILHNGSQHAMFFNPNSAFEYDASYAGFQYGPNYGVDYRANTISMVTECTYATPECNITHNDTGTEDISIPYHCYDDFSGDLGQTPSTGHERLQGFNMSFYSLVDGTPRNIPVQTQSNPFTFYAATAVNSIDLAGFRSQSNRSEGQPGNGSLVDGGRGFLAFALKCEATIYDVTFSLINGSFADINTTLSSPQKASIVKAPMQVGFGQYHLYQAAALSAVATNASLNDTMAKAFSQTAMALASGPFDVDDNLVQRFRWSVQVTRVPKAPFWYLVVVCLVYAVFGIVMTMVAFYLRRVKEVREQHAKLMVEWGPVLEEQIEDKALEKVESRSASITGEMLARRSDDHDDRDDE